ncbi:PREDICTED: speckle-type POZ protein-like [Erythranthe guttata]|uniref:speckle-type POZ protein-like n=1 Tax=Erythranthe guttata TaxID=4155 RepID=UPI00064DB558|nr:PREDICTED: speckle-type POZ protein-like [Erythranthe guttata]|eukprot:XP_012833031.1 PREDICTED: speckle-type POZ protein-like [Erythranthe guttata]
MFEPSNGYLVDDTCVFGAEVFIVKKELAAIECMSLRTFDIPYKRDWKIHNFSELGNFWNSGEFAAGGEKWCIRLYPKGYGKGVGSHVSMFLYYVGSGRVQAITDHVFSASDSIGGWGWPLFTELGTINDSGKGFLVDDSFLVHVEIFSVQDVPP